MIYDCPECINQFVFTMDTDIQVLSFQCMKTHNLVQTQQLACSMSTSVLDLHPYFQDTGKAPAWFS